MADRPNNFGEVLFKALGSTAEEAPSIFNNAQTRKKAEALQMFDAMLKLQEARQNEQSQKQAMALREQQMQESALSMQNIQLEMQKKAQEMADPFPQWEKDKINEQQMAQARANMWQWEQQVKKAREMGVNLSGNVPSGAGGGGLDEKQQKYLQYSFNVDTNNAEADKEEAALSAFSPTTRKYMKQPRPRIKKKTYQEFLAELSSLGLFGPAPIQSNGVVPSPQMGGSNGLGNLDPNDPLDAEIIARQKGQQ